MNVAVFLSHFFPSRIKCIHCSKMDLRVEVQISTLKVSFLIIESRLSLFFPLFLLSSQLW